MSTKNVRTTTKSDAQPTVERERLIEEHLGLAYSIARSYAIPGVVTHDDVRQVAAEALVRAARRFDPGQGKPFPGFASQYVSGSLKRHLRDQSWAVRPPRRLQEHALVLRTTSEELTHALRRQPSVSELAEHLGWSVGETHDALRCATTYRSQSLETPQGQLRRHPTLNVDDQAERIDNEVALRTVVPQLAEQDRELLTLRYWHNQTQAQIAQQLHVSQMQVSRLLQRCLGRLRRQLAPEGV